VDWQNQGCRTDALDLDTPAVIQRFLPLEIGEIKEPRIEESRRMQAEGEKILAAVDSSDRVVVLDPRGEAWTSEQFAAFVQKHMHNDSRRLPLLLGDSAGCPRCEKTRGCQLGRFRQ